MHGAYILARYSTDQQNEDSIEVQVEQCSAWCQRQGLPVLDVFADMAVSGMKDTRPQYARMMQQLKQGGADTVVIYDQSRMFRKMTAWFGFRDELENLGARVVSVTQPTIGGDLRDPSNFLVEGSMALFNQMWVLQTRQKVTEKMRYMAKTGQHTGGVPALGYCVKDGRLEIEPNEAETVRLIFQLYAAGNSYREIIEELNRRELKTKAGRPFGNNSLHDLLKNERYIGTIVYGMRKTRPDGKRNSHAKAPSDCIRIENGCPAIIDKDTFQAVQQRLAENRRKGGRPVAKEAQPLKGKVFCGECGGAMTMAYSVAPKNNQKYAYYKCTRKERNRTCEAKNIRKDRLEDIVAEAVRSIFSNEGKRQTLAKVLRDCRDDMQREAGPRMAAMVKALQDVEKKLDNATEAVLSGLNSPALRDKITQLEAQKDSLNRDINIYHAEIQHTTIDDNQIEYLLQKAIAAGGADDAAILSLVVRVEVFAAEIKIWTIIDGPPDRPTGGIDKTNVATLVPMPSDMTGDPCDFAHNSGYAFWRTKAKTAETP